MTETDRPNESIEEAVSRKIAQIMAEDAGHATKLSGAMENGLPIAWKRRNIPSTTMSDYMTACRYFLNMLPSEILSDKVVEEHIEGYIRQNSHLKDMYPAGWRCCPTIIFCSNHGNPLDDTNKEDGDHLQDLILDKDGNTVSGFAPNPSNIGRIIPAKMRQFQFVIPPYHEDPNMTPEDRDRADRDRLTALYRKAIEGLRAEIQKYSQ